jgi:hypothetical protein
MEAHDSILQSACNNSEYDFGFTLPRNVERSFSVTKESDLQDTAKAPCSSRHHDLSGIDPLSSSFLSESSHSGSLYKYFGLTGIVNLRNCLNIFSTARYLLDQL